MIVQAPNSGFTRKSHIAAAADAMKVIAEAIDFDLSGVVEELWALRESVRSVRRRFSYNLLAVDRLIISCTGVGQAEIIQMFIGQFETVEQWRAEELAKALEAYVPAIVRLAVPVEVDRCFESVRRAVLEVPDFTQRPGMAEFCSLF
jgi:hypothetical protein